MNRWVVCSSERKINITGTMEVNNLVLQITGWDHPNDERRKCRQGNLEPGPRVLESQWMDEKRTGGQEVWRGYNHMAWASEELLKEDDGRNVLPRKPWEWWSCLLVLKYWGWEDERKNQCHLKRKMNNFLYCTYHFIFILYFLRPCLFYNSM